MHMNKCTDIYIQTYMCAHVCEMNASCDYRQILSSLLCLTLSISPLCHLIVGTSNFIRRTAPASLSRRMAWIGDGQWQPHF